MIEQLLRILPVLCLASIPDIAIADEFKCPSGETARKWFNEGKLAELPNYSEPKIGGARVQRQHPNTYLFGQAKFLSTEDGRSLGVCQYSNHVGLVAHFQLANPDAVGLMTPCTQQNCEDEAHWRTEHTNSTSEEDQAGLETIDVCVVTRSGVDYPSTRCVFTPREP